MPLTWLHTQHSGGEGFSLPEAAQPSGRRGINLTDIGVDLDSWTWEATMHRLLLIAAILAGLLFPFPSASQEVRKDVQELYQLCKHESGKDFCLGYISGVADHMLLTGAFLRAHGNGLKEEERDLLADLSACMKGATLFEGVVQTFINWAEKHPEEGNLTMQLGVVEALSEIWPCD